jgi:hypothetical protein
MSSLLLFFFILGQSVGAVEFGVHSLEGEPGNRVPSAQSIDLHTISADLVITSIGYKV